MGADPQNTCLSEPLIQATADIAYQMLQCCSSYSQINRQLVNDTSLNYSIVKQIPIYVNDFYEYRDIKVLCG